jgi:hypothetical protein
MDKIITGDEDKQLELKTNNWSWRQTTGAEDKQLELETNNW